MEYPVGAVFAEKLRAGVDWDRVASGVEPSVEPDRVDLERAAGLTRPRLEVIPEVEFSTDMNTLVVRVGVAWITPPRQPGGRNGIGFVQRYEFAWAATHLRKKMRPEDATSAWIARSREEVIELVELGMDTVIELWAFHLDHPVLPAGEGSWNPLHTSVVQYGKKIDQRGDIVWLRRGRNSTWLYALHRDIFWAKVPPQ